MPIRRTTDVEAVRFGEVPWISPCRADREPESLTRSDHLPVELEILACAHAAHLNRPVIPEYFLDAARKKTGFDAVLDSTGSIRAMNASLFHTRNGGAYTLVFHGSESGHPFSISTQHEGR